MKLSEVPKAKVNNSVYIMQALVVSTKHISEKDFDSIFSAPSSATCNDGGFVMFFVADWDDPSFYDDQLSSEANKLFRAVAEKDYAWIRIDGECGDVFDDLPTFDW